MTAFTADDFAQARFAEHPDGRIAARINPKHRPAWVAERPSDFTWDWHNDHTMAADPRSVSPAGP